MADSDKPETSPSSTDGQIPRVDRVEEELERLKALWEKDNRGLVGWAKRWGVILALVVAVFAVPRGGVDVYHIFWNQPHTELIAGTNVVMGYDPDAHIVTFVFGFGAANTGTRDDFVRDLHGSVQNTSTPGANPLSFTIRDMKCSSHGAKIDFPFPIQIASPASIACNFALAVPEPKHGPFAQAGDYHLVMKLSGLANTSPTLDFCFYVAEGSLNAVFDSAKSEPQTFWYPDCRQAALQ